jgi:acetyl-CoA carboxylase biotin carboxyl carrier protein
MDFKEIQELIKLVSKSGLTEFKYVNGDTKIVIRTTDGENVVQQFVQPAPVAVAAPVVNAPAPAPISTSAPEAPKVEAPKAESTANLLQITSPIVGTFYRSSSPEKPAYAKVGDAVDKGKVVCIIEAMKLFNEIESEVKGTIVKVLVEDATPVEYGQPLFLVEP